LVSGGSDTVQTFRHPLEVVKLSASLALVVDLWGSCAHLGSSRSKTQKRVITSHRFANFRKRNELGMLDQLHASEGLSSTCQTSNFGYDADSAVPEYHALVKYKQLANITHESAPCN
jgi:hypothetical protein